MSLPVVLERIALLQGAFAPAPPPPAAAPTATFSAQLQGAAAGTTTLAGATPVANGGTPAGQAIVNLVRNELGVTEDPPGSNESARISQYRKATAGAPGPGPWCAYFVSWAAREAGVPIGDSGQGYGLVDDVWAWGERSGKATPASAGPPQAGDLIVWDEHIGVVESVAADGTITTIEGNSSHSVARRTYGSDGGGAIGWVRLG